MPTVLKRAQMPLSMACTLSPFQKAQDSKKMALDSWGQLDPGTRELTQWVKDPLCKHEDLSLIPELTQNPGTAAHLGNRIRREARTGISQGFAG